MNDSSGQRVGPRDERAASGAQLELPGLAAAHRQPVGEAEREDRAAAVGVDIVEPERAAGAAADVERPVAQPLDRRAGRPDRRGCRPR